MCINILNIQTFLSLAYKRVKNEKDFPQRPRSSRENIKTVRHNAIWRKLSSNADIADIVTVVYIVVYLCFLLFGISVSLQRFRAYETLQRAWIFI